MTGPFAEYREVRSFEPLRQGDVLESTDSGAPMWCRHLFVITADCDLAHSKNQGRITCVPLLRADEYLLEMQLPRLLERHSRKYVRELHEIVSRLDGKRVSEDRWGPWIQGADDESILSALGLEGEKEQRARELIEGIRLLEGPRHTLNEAVSNLVESQSKVAKPANRTKLVNGIVAELTQCFRNAPGDALFISSIAPGNELGYFAYLRHIEQIWEPDIAIGPGRRSVKYRRVAKLGDRYAHALVQRFALVFLSIGLPDEYEQMRDLHAELIGDEFK